ncbi:gamma-glutamyltransferase [Phycicoccus sp. BSK3Z-2]|uniref:Glutathione hydrolase proenzyme n=1 Tax=Phycicoccus avicenniae TaxID=2828860 RepID=A0A941DAK1_9MICO|nr:gamma-glutamyltransferase [Phycicoccus avicenniae]MBR7744153.1 gamma-glutamyltransferase [Phycicoccus avicenniae]
METRPAPRPSRRGRVLVVALASAVAGGLALGTPAVAGPPDGRGGPPAGRGGPPPVGHDLPKVAVMTGSGGAVSSVDAVASQVGIDVLAAGGNATDAAIATTAALGVTEPYSTGIGGGGFFVHYDAASGTVETIDGRETAPMSYGEDVFLDADGEPLPFRDVVGSGLSVGVPGTPATWERAAERWGTQRLSTLLKPAERLARRGFVVDATFHDQTAANAERFSLFPETADVFLPGGAPPEVGTVFRNPDLARAYRELRTRGVESLYEGRLGRAVVAEVQDPTTVAGAEVFHGRMTRADLATYEALDKEPVHSRFRGRDVYGMPVPSSGGITVAEILNLVEAYDERTGEPMSDVDDVQYLHRFSEASATAFADRNRYIGDVPGVPAEELVSQGFADERSCLFDARSTLPRPVPFGSPDGDYADCDGGSPAGVLPHEGMSTTHLSVVDRWGNAVSYTSTIEQTGGSGITVPGWGFLLNNELTDFEFEPITEGVPHPNLPGPGKRPRSSMAPTVVVGDGGLELVAGSPGGSTIITTVAQVLLGHYDRGLDVGDAIAAPRLSSRNGSSESAEPAVAGGPLGAGLTALGHRLSSTDEIGAATGIAVLGPDRYSAAAEPTRRGGGSAMVVRPE